jgi:hypothetical protein
MTTRWVDLESEYEEDDTIYSEDGRESLMDDDEISAEESAFMEGWDDALG